MTVYQITPRVLFLILFINSTIDVLIAIHILDTISSKKTSKGPNTLFCMYVLIHKYLFSKYKT